MLLRYTILRASWIVPIMSADTGVEFALAFTPPMAKFHWKRYYRSSLYVLQGTLGNQNSGKNYNVSYKQYRSVVSVVSARTIRIEQIDKLVRIELTNRLDAHNDELTHLYAS